MITIANNAEGRRIPHEFFGLSSNEKPIGKFEGIKIANGSMFIEMDTGKIYLFDEENQQWLEQ